MQVIPRQSTRTTLDEQRWQIVQTRSVPTSNTSTFYYAVISTKIFCRPSCPSRRPRRANVKFFDQYHDAVKAGFRPCKRCKPDQTLDPNHDDASKLVVQNAQRFVVLKDGVVTLTQIAEHVGLSSRYFHGLFKRVVGVTPAVYASRIVQRVEAEKKLDKVSDVVVSSGYEFDSGLTPDDDFHLSMLDFDFDVDCLDYLTQTLHDDSGIQSSQCYGTGVSLENMESFNDKKSSVFDDFLNFNWDDDSTSHEEFFVS